MKTFALSLLTAVGAASVACSGNAPIVLLLLFFFSIDGCC